MDDNKAEKNSILETLRVKIGAGHPVLNLVSSDEHLVLVTLKALAKTKKKALWTWSLSDGLAQVVGDDADPELDREGKPTGYLVFKAAADQSQPVRIKVSEYESPVNALKLARKWPGKSGTLFVFLGLGLSLLDFNGNVSHATIARLVKDIANEFPVNPRQHNTLCLVDPTAVCPPALEKSITVIHWPLPSAAEAEAIIDKAAAAEKVEVDLPDPQREKLVRAMSGLTYLEQDLALTEAVVSLHRLDASAQGFVQREKETILRQSGIRLLRPSQVSEAGGLDLVKQARITALATFTRKAETFGADRARTFLFGGLPGSGKSLAARFFAGDEMMLADINFGELKGKYVGDTDARTRRMFETLVRMAPICARLEEFEKTFGNVDKMDGDNGTSKGQFAQWLTFTEESTAPVLMICTANWPDQLPPEAMSRFDEVFYFGEPEYQERIDILSIHLAKRGRRPDAFALDEVAKLTGGYVGRELQRVVVKAIQRCLVQDGRELTTSDLLDFVAPGSLCRVRPMTEIMPEKIAAIKLWGDKHATSPASSAAKIVRQDSQPTGGN